MFLDDFWFYFPISHLTSSYSLFLPLEIVIERAHFMFLQNIIRKFYISIYVNIKHGKLKASLNVVFTVTQPLI